MVGGEANGCVWFEKRAAGHKAWTVWMHRCRCQERRRAQQGWILRSQRIAKQTLEKDGAWLHQCQKMARADEKRERQRALMARFASGCCCDGQLRRGARGFASSSCSVRRESEDSTNTEVMHRRSFVHHSSDGEASRGNDTFGIATCSRWLGPSTFSRTATMLRVRHLYAEKHADMCN